MDHPIKCSSAIVKLLQEKQVEYIFGHPGEQVLPLYDALRVSTIKHILVRHEQAAAHAADGYARSSGKIGVCVATAGPGALNLVMGVATAYKDAVPMLVITGDVPTYLKGEGGFQDVELCNIFQNITLESFYAENAPDAILKLKLVLKMLKYGPTGPVHINIPKDVLEEELDYSLLAENVKYYSENEFNDFSQAVNAIENCKKPLVIAGSGIIWSHSVKDFRRFINNNKIPVATTYPARGVLSEYDPLSLGMIGTRGTGRANYAGVNSDVIIALGCRLSERTLVGIGDAKIIHVNIDSEVLKGHINIQSNVKNVLHKFKSLDFPDSSTWLSEIRKKFPDSLYLKPKHKIQKGPLKPQEAIKQILKASGDSTIVNDAGSHTTWVTLLKKVKKPGSLIFSGSFGPMGYGLPASIGCFLACPQSHTVVITGDGGFQMTLQELATIKQENIPVVICVLNNHCLGIIRQWQDTFYQGAFQVALENPNFVMLGKSYGIDSVRVESSDDVFNAVDKAIKSNKPYLVEIIVDPQENIPLPSQMRE
ncbi:thiamine pyrophosphate-binding protein [Methanobacterium alkalithermotolerans]|uniref:Thiamine pyrophosphate-binding protein n=1 Tax=Methanobacterium alkalithermotolerans TaxID=2731220 RepID=A0A8T8K9S5_9EURY|nr:thiamine pyrophosphate-binding protein [Methanobacterium alkalithermotolerans]QUH23600.1 thiamine pyrophosphate-binding protein [Methanobacterium alkalithermotolerans]